MFSKACDVARHFTRPLVISLMKVSGECDTIVGSFVVLNRGGWVISAWHVFQRLQRLADEREQVRTYDAAVAQIQGDSSASPKDRAKRLKKLKSPPKDAARRFSVWWSWDRVTMNQITGIQLPAADILVGRLEPFDPAWVPTYPRLKDPGKPLPQGTSLCRLGFPFASVKATYDSKKDVFSFEKGSALPLFPIEGILTRALYSGKHADGFDTGFVETSSPGLMGQSGGPIVDINGTVWAIQSQTQHLSLGFDPPVPGGRPNEKEHQFLNVGWGTDPQTIIGLLSHLGVEYTLAEY